MAEGLNMLNTPTYITSGVILLFVIISILCERGIHTLEHKLQKRKGLLAASRHMTQEIMLVGVVSLFLTVVQDQIASICVKESVYNDQWAMNHSLNNYCDQCSCNSDVMEWQKEKCYEDLHYDVCAADDYKGRRLLAEAAGSASSGSCGEGKMPLVSINTLHQAHLLIFCIAAGHIIVSALVLWFASRRVHSLNKSISEDDDKLLQAVKIRSNRSDRYGGSEIQSEAGAPAEKLTADEIAVIRAAAKSKAASVSGRVNAGEAPSPESSDRGVYKSILKSSQGSWTRNDAPIIDTQSPLAQTSLDLRTSVPEIDIDEETDGDERVRGHTSTAGPVGEAACFPGQDIITPCLKQYNDSPNDRTVEQMEILEMAYLEEQSPAGRVLRCKHWSTSDIDDKGPIAGRVKDKSVSFFRSLVRPLTAQEFKLMRASFYFTHHPGPRFNFEIYVRESLEEDISKVVGITPEMWGLTLILSLVVGPYDWLWDMVVIAGVVLVLFLDTRLVTIVRTVTRKGKVRVLNNNHFWFKRPSLLLHLIRAILFLASLTVSHILFITWQFGVGSCYWKQQTGRVWFWLDIAVTIYVLFDLAFVTLPVYSIAVLMSDQYKKYMLEEFASVVNVFKGLASEVRMKRSAADNIERTANRQSSVMSNGVRKFRSLAASKAPAPDPS